MDYNGVQRIYQHPLYVKFKKHYCPDCDARLRTVDVEKVLRPGSAEAEKLGLRWSSRIIVKNVKYIWTEFECPQCKRRFMIDEMRKIEKG